MCPPCATAATLHRRVVSRGLALARAAAWLCPSHSGWRRPSCWCTSLWQGRGAPGFALVLPLHLPQEDKLACSHCPLPAQPLTHCSATVNTPCSSRLSPPVTTNSLQPRRMVGSQQRRGARRVTGRHRNIRPAPPQQRCLPPHTGSAPSRGAVLCAAVLSGHLCSSAKSLA